jgi:hypothetical protein
MDAPQDCLLRELLAGDAHRANNYREHVYMSGN